MKNFSNLITILIIIVFTGILGGVGNYFVIRNQVLGISKSFTFNEFYNMPGFVVLGLIAAGVIPLFLNIISSDLLQIKESKDNYRNYLIFASLCLVSALFSNHFLPNTYNAVFSKLKAAENQEIENRISDIEILAIEAKKNADAALETEILIIEEKENPKNLSGGIESLAIEHNLSENEQNVFGDILKQKIAYKKDLISLGQESNQVLSSLVSKGLIQELSIEKDTIIRLQEIALK